MNASKINDLRLDEVLKMFVECSDSGVDRILKEHLFSPGCPADYDKAVSFLAEEGCLKEFQDSFALTYKGRMIYDKGGFVGKHRREGLAVYSAVAAAVLSAVSAVLSAVALCI